MYQTDPKYLAFRTSNTKNTIVKRHFKYYIKVVKVSFDSATKLH